jgi:sugar lactone lactonase YvrE
MDRSAQRAVLVALAMSAACSHAPIQRQARADVFWPPPPAAPRVRLLSVIPDPNALPAAAPWWRRLVTFVAGTDEAEATATALSQPFGVAAARDGSLFVTDPPARTLLRVTGEAVQRVDCPGLPWSSPTGVAIGPDDAIYVADESRVVRVDSKGSCAPLAEGRFERATGLVIGGDAVYVSDPPRHAVVVLGLSGELRATWGNSKSAEGSLHFPSGLALASDGTLLVSDTFNFSIARFDSAGRLLGRIGGSEESLGGLERPKGIAGDAAGRVYVSDAARDRVVVYRHDGTVDYFIGGAEAGPSGLAQPAGIAVAGTRLLVVDSLNGRVQNFEILGGAP